MALAREHVAKRTRCHLPQRYLLIARLAIARHYSRPRRAFVSTQSNLIAGRRALCLADFCSGWIRTFNPSDGTAAGFATGLSSVVDTKVANDGSLWYLQRGGSPSGQVHHALDSSPRAGNRPTGDLTGT